MIKIYIVHELINGKIKAVIPYLPKQCRNINFEFNHVRPTPRGLLVVWLRGFSKRSVKKRAAKLFNDYRK